MTTFNVGNADQLTLAIASASGGDTILLSSGEYGALNLNGMAKPHLAFASAVTIASADPGNPAVFTAVDLRGVANLTLDGLKFDLRSTATTVANVELVSVELSSGVTIRNATFDGDNFKGVSVAETGYGTGFGLRVQGSQGVVLENSDFTNFRVCGSFSDTSGLTLRGNTFTGMSGDGIKFSGVQDVLIEGNTLGAHRSSAQDGYHHDKIQFFTMNTTEATQNITIRGNFLNSGDGPDTQSIFMRNEAVDSQGGGAAMFYRNVLIENNLIYNAHIHGIAVGESDGLIIRNNTLLHNTAYAGQPAWAEPKISVAGPSQHVAITENVGHGVPVQSGQTWLVADNLIVQRTDPSGATYYDKLFVGANQPNAPLEALKVLAGGMIQTLGWGAEMARVEPAALTLTGTDASEALTGGGGRDIVAGLGGDDMLRGEGGNDSLDGGGGNDTLDGGAGDDILRLGSGTDRADGGVGNDTFFLSGTSDRNDLLVGGAGADRLEIDASGGNASRSSLVLTDIEILDGNGMSLVGTGSANTLNLSTFTTVQELAGVRGGSGSDTIIGSAMADTLSGEAGLDTLSGGGGNDVLDGGRSNDRLTGGAGSDVFRFVKGQQSGADTVTDFDIGGSDVIRLEGFGVGLAQVAANTSFGGGSAMINLAALGGSGSLVLQGVTALDFTGGEDFAFF